MPKVCALTGKKTRFQKTSTRKGSPKRKGGVGLKAVGVHSRTVKPNLQKKTIWRNAKPERVWLSTKALRQLDPALLVNPGRQRRE
jgi:large subunit ribosomal protein L28